MKIHLLIQVAVVSSMLLTPQLLFSQNTITVTDCNLNGWIKEPKGNSKVKFTNGPGTPPLGKGSFNINAPDAHSNVGRIRNGQYSGLLLSAITGLSFSTFIEQRSSTVNPYSDAPFLVLQVDANGDNVAEFHLVFDPSSQTQPFVKNNFPDQGLTKVGVWQTWDMYHGGWFDGAEDPQNGFPLFSLTTFIALHPGARILNDATQGGAAVRLSGGGPASSGNFIGDIDNFRIGVNGVTTTYDFEFTTANAGDDKNVVYGYGSSCTILNGSAAGGVAPYTYLWSPGGTAPNNANTQVCPAVTTTYLLTVTDANGCSRTDNVSVMVNDVRCGNKMDKVSVCHHGEDICISPDAVPAHLHHGNVLGSCAGSSIAAKANIQKEATVADQFSLFNYPNPFTGTTKIIYTLPFDGRVSIKIYEFTGREIASVVNEIKKRGLYNVDFNAGILSGGVYYYSLSVSSATKVLSQMKKMIIVQ